MSRVLKDIDCQIKPGNAVVKLKFFELEAGSSRPGIRLLKIERHLKHRGMAQARLKFQLLKQFFEGHKVGLRFERGALYARQQFGKSGIARQTGTETQQAGQ